MTQDFWLTSGWHLLERDENGFMVPTVDFMRAYFYRDEVAPEPESCAAELALQRSWSDNGIKEMFRSLPKPDSCAEQKIWTIIDDDVENG